MTNLLRLIARWREFYYWLPLLVALAIAGWIGIGALAPRLSTDTLQWLLELPIVSAYAAAAGVTYLTWRRALQPI